MPAVHPAILGPFGPAQLTCIRSWKRRGLKTAFVHLCNKQRRQRLLESSVDAYLRVAPSAFMSGASDGIIADFVSRHAINAITALSYDHIRRLHGMRLQLPEHLIFMPCSERLLDFLTSKSEQISLAQDVGFKVAETIPITPFDADNVPDHLFPLVTRPDNPAGVKPFMKVNLFHDREELRKFLGAITELQQPLVGQKFIPGHNIVVHGVRSAFDGRQLLAGFEVTHMLDGVTLALKPCSLPDDVIACCKAFCDRIALTGVYHFELRRCDETGDYHFLEINGRLGGTTGKVFRLGFDEPGLLVDACTLPDLPLIYRPQKAVSSNRQAVVKASIRGITNKLTDFDYPRPPPFKYWAGLMKGFFLWRDEIYHPGFPRTSVAYLLERFAK